MTSYSLFNCNDCGESFCSAFAEPAVSNLMICVQKAEVVERSYDTERVDLIPFVEESASIKNKYFREV